jgi:hypothetical protein
MRGEKKGDEALERKVSEIEEALAGFFRVKG